MTRSKKAESKAARRAFSPEFKREAVQLMRERRALGVSLAQVGRELDVRPDLLRAWAQQLEPRGRSGGRDVGLGNGPVPSGEEVRRLQRENAVLRQERDFLKKAAAFFAKESR
jgi:transposase